MKALMKGTSCLLSVLLVFSLIIVAFSPIAAHAETFSNVSEFPNFDMDCYVADLFTKDGHSLNTLIESELNSESRNKIMKNSIESNSILMGSMTAWQVATFEASDVTSDSVTELGYYESIILSSINTAMKSSRVKDIFDNAVIKDGKMLFSSFKDILKTEYYITDFSLKTYKSLSAEDQSAYIKSFGKAFEKQYPKLDKTSDALKIFSTVIKTAKSFEECMNNYAAYSLCSLTNRHLTKVINDLYKQCPAEKVTLKAALLNISSACTSAELDFGADALDAICRGTDIIFGVLTDGWVTKVISAHPAGLALMLGRAVGKTVSNILFSTDAICENYYKMCCFDEFEQLVRSVTRYEMNTYTENNTNDNANNMFWAIRLMFNINEVGCDLSIDYAKTIYEKSIAGIFLDKTEYETYKKTVEFIRNCKRADYSTLMTSYTIYLEEDYPEIYAAYMKLMDEIEKPVVHANGISFTKKHMTLGLADDTFFFWNNAEVSPSNASNRAVNYSSSDESIVSIKPGNTLMIELHQTGTVTITATSEDGGFTDELIIDVVDGHGVDGIHLEDPITDIKKSGKLGENVFYNLYADGLLKIYGSGKIYDFHSYSYSNREYRTNVKNVLICDGITSIGEFAFDRFINLSGVILPNSLTSISDGAFSGCSSLKNISFPDSLEKIGEYSFSTCSKLCSVTIPDSVTSIGEGAFLRCLSLNSIEIGANVSNIDCQNDSGIVSYCPMLERITVSHNNKAYDSRNNCNAIIDTQKNILLSGCKNTIVPSNVTCIGEGAFAGCNISSIVIPDSVTTISSSAFYLCENLSDIIIPDNVSHIGESAFSGTAWYKSQPDGVIYAGKVAYKFRGTTYPKTISLKSGTRGIADRAFVFCKSLEHIIIPDSVVSIGEEAFEYCSSLLDVNIPNSVTYMGKYAFADCSSLENVSTGNGLITISSNAFSRCSSLKNVYFGSNITTIEQQAFYECTSVKSILLPKSIVSIKDGSFLGCTSLVDVNIPDSLIELESCVFGRCSALTTIIIPNKIERISDETFSGCESLTDVVIPYRVSYLGWHSFHGCKSLKKITILNPNAIISNKSFGYYWDNSFNERKIANFSICSYKGSYSERYAIENGFEFVAIAEPIEKSDENTGISITLPADLTLHVDDATGSGSVKNIELAANEKLVKAFDITLLENGEETQPDGSVTVKIPCNNKDAKVYRVEANGSLTDMNAVYQDGFMVFTTDHFNTFVIAEPKIILIGDVNGDGNITIGDVTEIQRHLAELIHFTDEQLVLADTNGDGKVDINDATHLQKYLAEFDGIVLGKQTT